MELLNREVIDQNRYIKETELLQEYEEILKQKRKPFGDKKPRKFGFLRAIETQNIFITVPNREEKSTKS